jgi:phosphoribosylformylglycinamidine synthase
MLGDPGFGGILTGAHDTSVGGLAVAVARLAIGSGVGATITLPREAAEWPTASLFGERGGRVLVALAPGSAGGVAAAAKAASVPALAIGRAEGRGVSIAIGQGRLSIELDQLREAWSTAF